MTLNYATSGNGAPSTNRINTDSQSFSYSYDQAGNMTAGMGQSFTYDGANRLKTAGNGNSSFGYDGDGTRVKKTENGANTFYVKSSALGQTVMEVNSTGVMRAFVYSGNKLVAMQGTDGQFYWLHTNHLGNARTMTDASGNVAYGGQFDPYGQTLAEWSATGNTTLNTKKFTGYERDAATGLDYAQARMYNSSRGRFMTPDPLGLEAADASPQSLNRYAYVSNDPVNFSDPEGLLKCGDVKFVNGIFKGQTISQIMNGSSGEALMAQLLFLEGGTIYDSDLSNIQGYYIDLIGIGSAILNQWDVDNGRLRVFNTSTGNLECPLGQCLNRSLADIVRHPNFSKDDSGSVWNNGVMRESSRKQIDTVLNTNVEDLPWAEDVFGNYYNRGCLGMVSTISVASELVEGNISRYYPNGLAVLFWNKASPNSTTTFPGSAGYIGVPKSRAQGHTFWGLWIYLQPVPPPSRPASPARPRMSQRDPSGRRIEG